MISFGRHSQLKDYATICAYTGEPFTKSDRATLEHIKPRSKGGRNSVVNYLPVKQKINEQRDNMPLTEWFKIHPEVENNIRKVLAELDGKWIDGVNWSKEVAKTLNSELGRKVFFKGRFKKID